MTKRQRPATPPANGRIYVLAGCNGAGKSSLGGRALLDAGIQYFNPDEAARDAMLVASNHGAVLTQRDANIWAWNQGKAGLERAIAEHGNFAFESTLGGNTIVQLLLGAAEAGIEVRVWYAGLESVEMHIERVRQRVARGGHDIPRADIERRYKRSRLNLIRLLPQLTELRVYDNSAPATAEVAAAPRLLLHWRDGAIVGPPDMAQTPAWAKPIVESALRLDSSRPTSCRVTPRSRVRAGRRSPSTKLD